MTGRKATILHVDDDEANRYAVTRLLVKAGFDVTEAASGADALQLVAKKPDLVILDVRLPDIDGFEVCRRIKSNTATAFIPVLHLSASLVTSADKAHGLNGGAEGYLIRPVEPVELIATVNALLRGKAAEEALRTSEERFALAVDAGELGTFHCPMPPGDIIWNDKCKEQFWLPSEADVTFDRFYSIIHPEDRERTRQAIDRTITQREPYDIQYRTVAPDGRIRWLRAKGRAYFDDKGDATRFDGVTLDITEQKTTEAERERLYESEQAALAEARRANQMKDEFLATLSHELRTPLNAILGWSQILRTTTPDPGDLSEGLEIIERNARAQTQIIEDLLDMSRIVSGKLRLDMQLVDLIAVAQAAVDTMRPAAEAKGVQLLVSLDRQAAPISGDPNRLHQIFWNLLTNAVKFTPTGGRVEVVLERSSERLQVRVADTGEGIDADFLPHVFDRFRQADASTTRRHGGLGLGLAIVKQLVELHGGEVSVSSAGAGKGTTFLAAFPLVALTAASERKAVVEADLSGSSSPRDLQRELCEKLKGVTILLVDDEADNLALVRRVFEDCGSIVRVASSAAEGFASFQANRPDVLISDIGMPGEDGYSFMRRIRALGREAGGNVPALALTAYARPDDRVRAMRVGFNMHVVKPVEPLELIAMVASIVERSR